MSSLAPSPHGAGVQKPTKYLVIALLACIVIGWLCFRYSPNPMAGAINTFLLGYVVVAFTVLIITESRPNEFSLSEVIIGLVLLSGGIAVGSAPTLYPYFAKVWASANLGLDQLDPLAPPTKGMWELKDNVLKPTNLVQERLQFLVVLDGTTHGITVPKDGMKIDKPDKAQVYVRDLLTGRTSSSVPLN